MAEFERILQLTPGRLSQWYEDGVVVDPGTVTIGITRADGTALVAASAGTQGAGLTEVAESDRTHTINGTAFNTHTADATLVNTRNASLGAAIGSGMVWTFAAPGLHIPQGTANGVVITCPVGTAQHLDFNFVWDE